MLKQEKKSESKADKSVVNLLAYMADKDAAKLVQSVLATDLVGTSMYSPNEILRNVGLDVFYLEERFTKQGAYELIDDVAQRCDKCGWYHCPDELTNYLGENLCGECWEEENGDNDDDDADDGWDEE